MNYRMSAAEQTMELVETTDIQMFLPVMREIDFGDRFLLSMLHWCGIGRRSTPLDYWKVFLQRVRDEVVGVSGLYRQPGMAQNVYYAGSVGLPFARVFDDRASERAQCMRSSVLPKASGSKDFGVIPGHRMISLSVFTRASASKCWAQLPIARQAELWI